MDYSPAGSSVHGILQVKILEWIAMPSFRGLPHPGIEPRSTAQHILPKTLILLITPNGNYIERTPRCVILLEPM